MLAKIYRPARNAMQSGTAKSQEWLLEFESETPRTVDPLMGWISECRHQHAGAHDGSRRARRRSSSPSARASPSRSTEPREAKRVIKAYADNFSAYRKRQWTH